MKLPHPGDCICQKCIKALLSDDVMKPIVELIGRGYDKKK
jgi:hypothetical protein